MKEEKFAPGIKFEIKETDTEVVVTGYDPKGRLVIRHQRKKGNPREIKSQSDDPDKGIE